MKAVMEQAALAKLLGRVARAVEQRNTIPILSNVLIDISQDTLSVKATDLDLEVIDSISAEVAKKGSTTVPARLFHDIIRKMPSGSQVVLEQTGDSTAVVKSGRSRFTLQTLPVSDYPNLSADDLNVSFAVAGKDLRRLVDRAAFAISTEETRYYLNGIYLHAVKQGNVATLRAVATDGHRLAQVEYPLPEGAADLKGIIVPRKTVGEITRLFDAGENEILVEASSSKIRFSAGDLVLTSKLIDGTFPDYGRVIPVNNDKKIAVVCKDMLAATDRVATISSEKGRAVKMSLGAGRITLSCQNPDAGTATDELEAEYSGDAMDIGFNSRYLHDIFTQIQGDTVKLDLGDPGSPALLCGTDESILYVLMPMRV
ncbi:DNA polymerase III subunit beta [Bradyrhizobium sp. 41S5]|uniref:DNA polymerase III subunit beta n=1 Tax=Bradyrhizobium sp. 41S5 TaxID=1404443 RepID=UPI00156B0B0D|nr:DNA polymerase III subunit beta [Bradyrhizobium sp. 41S5]UFX49054.1 DNA polymerase III subunit beta [Bradyrhizobium sp. 41S5]